MKLVSEKYNEFVNDTRKSVLRSTGVDIFKLPGFHHKQYAQDFVEPEISVAHLASRIIETHGLKRIKPKYRVIQFADGLMELIEKVQERTDSGHGLPGDSDRLKKLMLCCVDVDSFYGQMKKTNGTKGRKLSYLRIKEK